MTTRHHSGHYHRRGLALVAAAIWFEQDARLATGLLVGSSYLYGALGNLRRAVDMLAGCSMRSRSF